MLLGLMIALQIPAVQTAAVSRVLRGLSGNMNCEINVGSLAFHPFNTLIIKDVLILDKDAFSSPSHAKTRLSREGPLSPVSALKACFRTMGFSFQELKSTML